MIVEFRRLVTESRTKVMTYVFIVQMFLVQSLEITRNTPLPLPSRWRGGAVVYC